MQLVHLLQVAGQRLTHAAHSLLLPPSTSAMDSNTLLLLLLLLLLRYRVALPLHRCTIRVLLWARPHSHQCAHAALAATATCLLLDPPKTSCLWLSLVSACGTSRLPWVQQMGWA